MSTTETNPPASEEKPAAQPPKPERPAKADRAHSVDRPAIAVAVVVQLLVVFAVVLMVNYLGFRHYQRWDFSRNQKFALSGQTKNLLQKMKTRDERVQAIVFFPTAQAITEDVTALLREYEYASDRHFTVEFVTYRNLNRARELSEKYKFGGSDNIVILDYKGKSKFVNAGDMAEIDAGGQATGQPPVVRAFKGEEAITSALIELTDEKQNKLYLVTGHGEPELESGDINGLKAYLGRQNIKTEKLNLNNVDAVPAEASGILIFGPKGDFSEREMKLLADYWKEKKGRIVVLLNPAAKTQRLDDWLTSQGITPQHDRVLKTGVTLQMNESNQPVLRNGIVARAVGTFLPSGKEVVKDVAGVDIELHGSTESIAIDSVKGDEAGIRFVRLIEAGEGFWGETELGAGQVYFDGTKDHAGPLTLAVAAEKGGIQDQRVKVETGRMVVAGNSGFLTDEGLRVSDVGIDFALNAINWAFNREVIAGIPPKSKDKLKLSISDEQMNQLAIYIILAIPVGVAVIGMFVWGQRNDQLGTVFLILIGFVAVLGLIQLFLMMHRGGA